MHSWRNRLLNNAGKEVLIKVVVSALPTYVISVFQLPSSWCTEINSIVARFWWGATNGACKIHWKRWEAMTMAKREGGFGFKDMASFNLAMVANSAARLLDDPNALWARLLKCLYFQNGDFMYAVRGGQAS